MKETIINDDISLIPYYENFDETLLWYQDYVLCKQVDNIDYIYDKDMLVRMYKSLNEDGLCFYIKYKQNLVGDVTLKDNNELCIVISKPYQNMGIGKVTIKEIIKLAQKDNRKELRANIYDFNKQSRRMFESVGFKYFKDEWYIYRI